jgi:cytochrome oxidase Cu insertion factor (SCO1/SenC/PrrC family)
MKNRLFLFLLLFPAVCQAAPLRIQGDIEGLQRGDTLVFTFYTRPIYEVLSRDTLVVEQADGFSFTQELERTVGLDMRYLPVSEENKGSYLSMVVRPNDALQLRADSPDLAAVTIGGGFYRDPSVKRFFDQEQAHRRSGAKTRPQELVDLKKRLMNEVNDSEYAVYLYLDNIGEVDYDALAARYAALDADIKVSDMGREMEKIVHAWSSLQPDAEAPDFAVIDTEGKPVSLTDYKGKYLLLFCWESCGTTFDFQPRIKKLYERYGRDLFDIVALTPDDFKKQVLRLSADTPEATEYLRKQFTDLMVQPWPLAYTEQPENHLMKQLYFIWNACMFRFIGSDGKIIATSHYYDLEETMKTVEKTLAAATAE